MPIAVVLTCLAAWAGNDSSAAVSAVIDVHSEDLLVQPPAANWISYNGDYSGRRYSGLSEIDPGNLSELRAQWVFHARNSGRLEVTPVVVNGMMLVTAANDASALDARTGRLVWHHSWPVSEELIDDASQHTNRGVGVWHNRVYMETDNAHLLCLDARSGNLIWDVAYANWNKNYGATSAPLVVKDKVLVGTSGATTGCGGLLPPMMRCPAIWSGASGPYRVRANSVPKAGRENCTCMAAAPRGCREPTIPSSIRFIGEPAIPRRTSKAPCVPGTTSTPTVCWRSTPTPEN
ncbi:MAG: PQQ-binding-like beta-propeller repeat protein [Candidatus Sulfotelmatobacter sp.]